MSGARRCTGVILAGGGATRYGGRPKGLEPVGGARIIDRVAAALRPVCDDLLVIANDPGAAAWLPGVRVAADLRPGEGALGGLHAALAHTGTDVLVVAWDMPFVPGALLAALRARGARGDVDVALPRSGPAPRDLEPLCAWYGAGCLAAVEASLAAGDRRMIGFHGGVRVATMPPEQVAWFGAPELVFANVNTPEERARWAEAPAMAAAPAPPPMLAVVGKKHAGKTTLTVRLAAELGRRGHRVMTLKHGSHTFNLDPAATDTYRHYHEGHAERVAMASPDKFALVMRWAAEEPPEALAARFLGDADLVLCEGFKASALPKVEVFRREAHATPLWADGPAQAATWRALVSDAPVPGFPGPVFDLAAPDWLDALAGWVEREHLSPAPR